MTPPTVPEGSENLDVSIVGTQAQGELRVMIR